MIYGDFAGLVQLGIGLHLGTALLETFGQFDAAPLERRLRRLHQVLLRQASKQKNSATDVQDRKEKLDDLEESIAGTLFELEVFRLGLESEYKNWAILNTFCAVILVATLIFIAFRDEQTAGIFDAVLIVCISLLPAVLTMLDLRVRIWLCLRPMRSKVSEIEKGLGL